MARELTVSIDAMGGDAGPGIVVAALARSVAAPSRGASFILHGDEAALKPLFAKRAKLAERVDDPPRRRARAHGREAEPGAAPRPQHQHVARHRIGEEQGSRSRDLRRQHRRADGDVDVPAWRARRDLASAIAALWPTKRGQSVVLDVGANIACDAEQLVDFAIMGEAFARAVSASNGRPSACSMSAPKT